MKIRYVTEGSLGEYGQGDVRSPCDLLVFGFDGLEEVDYAAELAGETQKLEDMAILSREMGCAVLSGCITDSCGIRHKSVAVAENGRILGVTDMLHTGDTLQCSVRITFTEFKILEYTVVVLGDATGDGAVRSDDARQALRLAVGLDSAGAAVCRAADADQSGEVNSADARLILRAATGLDSLEGILA